MNQTDSSVFSSSCNNKFVSFAISDSSIILELGLAVPQNNTETCGVSFDSSSSWAEGFPPEVQLLTHLSTVLITNHLYMQLLTRAHNKALIHIIC